MSKTLTSTSEFVFYFQYWANMQMLLLMEPTHYWLPTELVLVFPASHSELESLFLSLSHPTAMEIYLHTPEG